MEAVHVRLALSGTYWGNQPQYRVLANDRVVKEGTAAALDYIEFDFEYDANATLAVELVNKTHRDTVLDEQNNIVKDLLLNIESVEIDGIDLKQMPRDLSVYTTYDNRTVTKCINLGWNGTWRLTWTEPFYLWLLEYL
jgi:hypothetical protein